MLPARDDAIGGRAHEVELPRVGRRDRRRSAEQEGAEVAGAGGGAQDPVDLGGAVRGQVDDLDLAPRRRNTRGRVGLAGSERATAAKAPSESTTRAPGGIGPSSAARASIARGSRVYAPRTSRSAA